MNQGMLDWQNANKHHLQPPAYAWPTIALFIFAALLFITSTLICIQGYIPVYLGLVLNAIAQFMCFTVLHDGTHRALSIKPWVNEGIGTTAALILTPFAGIKVFRFIHMQHHRFTNEGNKADPDEYCGKGRVWTRPLRWMTVDLHYIVFYMERWSSRPKNERREFALRGSLSLMVMGLIVMKGYGFWLVFLYLIPGRIATTWLALAFDFLPHYPHDTKASENEMRATNIRPNLSWLMTPIFLAQNYHLVHHLYPRIPFYRYAWVWKQAKKELIEGGARVVSWSGKELNP